MKDRKQTLKILALIISMIMLLAGCNSGSAAEKPQDDSRKPRVRLWHAEIPTPCTKTEEGSFNGISGERRVKNVMAGGEALDPEATYTVAGQDYHLLHSGDGFAMFEGAKGVILTGKLDSEVLIDYIKDSLGGEAGSDYADPYGQGRIKIIQ